MPFGATVSRFRLRKSRRVAPATTWGRSTAKFLQRENRIAHFARPDRIQDGPSALPRIGQHDSHDICSAWSFDHHHCARRRYDVWHQSCSKGIASFLCGRHFLRAFSSRDDAARDTRVHSGLLSYARQNNVVRNLSQTFLIAVGNEARAKRSAARPPFASPYCPCRAQIRRAHVQPPARLAVHSSMRVRESCLTFSPRASP